jgi:hypothetical protein
MAKIPTTRTPTIDKGYDKGTKSIWEYEWEPYHGPNPGYENSLIYNFIHRPLVEGVIAVGDWLVPPKRQAWWIPDTVNEFIPRAYLDDGRPFPNPYYRMSPQAFSNAINRNMAHCFPAHTPIATSLTSTTPIADLRVGDVVLAFDPAVDCGRGALVPRRVTRLYRKQTDEWVKLAWLENGETKELISTPGHHFLDSAGQFPTIADMIRKGSATVVLASGELAEVVAKRLVYSAATAHLSEQAQANAVMSGNAALKLQMLVGWQTYNFEVEDLHTYVNEKSSDNDYIQKVAA